MPDLTIAHSPDPDDVFMWWPLGSHTLAPTIDTEGFRFEPIPEDIQVLNRRAIESGDLDITAISIHAYPHVRARYRLTSCAGSFGDSYGPKLVTGADASSRPPDLARWIIETDPLIAVPGVHTTAFLALNLLVGKPFQYTELRFDRIGPAVSSGKADMGVLIHDAQLTYAAEGLTELADLGRWWRDQRALPLPLGGNVVRRDLDARFGPGASSRLARVLYRSIRHAMDHLPEGLRRIAPLYPTLDTPTLTRYLGMYVNDLTLDPGKEGREAISALLRTGHQRGLCPDPGNLDILEPPFP
jgi:1,4-dihydroxy-6-naphthoate synthase